MNGWRSAIGLARNASGFSVEKIWSVRCQARVSRSTTVSMLRLLQSSEVLEVHGDVHPAMALAPLKRVRAAGPGLKWTRSTVAAGAGAEPSMRRNDRTA